MRYGIRDYLLATSVLIGLAYGAATFAADDPQAAPASEAETSAAADQPAATPAADPPAAQPESAPQPEATAPPATEPAATDPAATEPADSPPAEATDPAPAEPTAPVDEAHADKAHADEVQTGDSEDSAHGGHGAGGEAHEGGGHDAHHDPYDLTHVNATEAIADPSEFKSDLAIWTFVVFLLLLALLGKFAWGPIMEGLERREASIAAACSASSMAAAKGAEQLRLYEAKLAAAAEETREMMARARKDAEAAGERIVAEAQQAAARERDKAVADIASAKNSALAEITERSVDLAVAMAGRMIQRQLTPDDRAGLIREALDQLPSQN